MKVFNTSKKCIKKRSAENTSSRQLTVRAVVTMFYFFVLLIKPLFRLVGRGVVFALSSEILRIAIKVAVFIITCIKSKYSSIEIITSLSTKSKRKRDLKSLTNIVARFIIHNAFGNILVFNPLLSNPPLFVPLENGYIRRNIFFDDNTYNFKIAKTLSTKLYVSLYG